jgi:hypothetical protein
MMGSVGSKNMKLLMNFKYVMRILLWYQINTNHKYFVKCFK